MKKSRYLTGITSFILSGLLISGSAAAASTHNSSRANSYGLSIEEFKKRKEEMQSLDDGSSLDKSLVTTEPKTSIEQMLVPVEMSFSEQAYPDLAEKLIEGVPSLHEYPDENCEDLIELFQVLYTNRLCNDRDSVFQELNYLFRKRYQLSSDRMGRYIDIDNVYATCGLDPETTLAACQYHIEFEDMEKSVPGIGFVYLQMTDAGISVLDLNDDKIREYLNQRTSDGSWFSDLVNDMYLIANMEFNMR